MNLARPLAFPEFHTSLHRLFCARRQSIHSLSHVPRRLRRIHPTTMTSPTAAPRDYERWTQHQLIARIRELERSIPRNSQQEIAAATELDTPPKRRKAFDFSKYETRLIALKFAYLGQAYNGFEHHRNNNTPLPTVEEVLWRALVKTRLISPGGVDGEAEETDREFWKYAEVDWEGCEYSKCGRTDRGVSAFGQVIGIRVRSAKKRITAPSSPAAASPSHSPIADNTADTAESEQLPDLPPSHDEPDKEKKQDWNDERDELPYIQLLNRVLPPDIRVYAWCPNPPPDFSARFSCKERRYKYFFTNPCFAPVPSSVSEKEDNAMREGYLDIEAMRTACSYLLGLHDFRNFCKIDASKQLENFNRRIFHASIDEVAPLSLPAFLSHPSLSPILNSESQSEVESPKLYCLSLNGSAFLWHQVRSIIALLFLVGQRLESPTLIPALLDVKSNPRRPLYEMASDAPLVLWDCIFPAPEAVQSTEIRESGYEDALEWVYIGDPVGKEGLGEGKWGRGGVVDDVWEVWRGDKMREVLSGGLLDVITSQGKSSLDSYGARSREPEDDKTGRAGLAKKKGGAGPRVFDGANVGRPKGKYVPVLLRERQESVEVVNEKYARRKGEKGLSVAREEDVDE